MAPGRGGLGPGSKLQRHLPSSYCAGLARVQAAWDALEVKPWLWAQGSPGTRSQLKRAPLTPFSFLALEQLAQPAMLSHWGP